MDRVQRWHGRERTSHGCAAKFRNLSHKKLGSHLLSEGDWQNRRPVDSLNDTPDSTSCSSGSGDDSFMFDLRSSSKQAGETPKKKLLAEELSQDMESKQRPPSVIARLMGLDALPPQQPVHKQPKIFSENYLQKTASIENKPSYESRPSRKKQDKEYIEFKDIFEVLETSKAENQSHPSVQKGIANAKPRDANMIFIKQKFIDAKRLSTDEKLRQSKEFHDALKVLNANKDLLLNFLQEPDSPFTKHLYDLHEAPPPQQFGHITVLKSSNASKHEHTDICWNAERKTDQWEAMNSLQKEFGHGHDRDGAYSLMKNMKSRSEEKDEDCNLPTRIVVLKPNTGKAQNASRSASSSSSIGFHSENHQLFAEVWNRKNSSNNMRHRSKSSREIAKEIIRQTRQVASNSSVRVSSIGLRGYAGNESGNELEAVPPTSRHNLDPKNKYSPSSSCSIESYVGMEAKKRLSESWKMTSQYQELGLVGKGSSRSTLGEMLAMPDRETQPFTSGSGDGLARNDGIARWGSPIGISSRDGWKDGYSRNHRRSKSVPALSFVFGSPKSGIGHGAIGNDRCLMSKAINQGSHRLRIRNSNHTEDSFLRDLKSKNEKSCSSFSTNRENNHAEQETHLSLGKPRENLVERDQADQKPIIPEPLSYVADKRLIVEEVPVPEIRDMNRPSSEEQLPESTECIMLDIVEESSIHDINESILKEAPEQYTEEGLLSANCSLPESESPGSFKEVDQPSPVSVLEPFVEDMSSGSECFERVSADLNGLRMQLQLLKLETSNPYGDEFGMNVSSDEDTGEESVNHLEQKGKNLGIMRTGENRDFSYVIDVFVDSGLDGVNREMILSAWHSLEIPVDSEVFEKLEKKYGEQLTWPRSERRLLFDRINNGLTEIFWPCMDPHPWVKPTTRRLATWCEEHLVEELWKLLGDKGQKGSNEASEKGLVREMRWLELGDEIDVLGKEIEKLLLDELIEEVISM
ncbi:uncharacterized protein LOC122652418 isoform X2 [Telopea speciosissima]|uniref:uncharacterized protein LOC122652418 isoform X2 n=1 Tax=Telopea speciosissima TaxID=54955 RepID=UPI001CC43009|nr:uncharacterized protein LOC122652418 isoform X2 [Telopea speciosissima]